MGDRKTSPALRPAAAATSAPGEIAAFVRQARAVMPVGDRKPGRLILALDATMSRQPTWDLACTLQAEMFDAADKAGALQVQLVYFRGFGECRASKFVADTAALKNLMIRIDCRAGHTQIGKVLDPCAARNETDKVDALV